jgi:quinol monooxygenase YgiN
MVMQKSEIYTHVHGELLVVAQWKAVPGQEAKISAILDEFLPQAQAEPGVKLFQIARDKADPKHFLFYELFADETAFAAHQASEHFKTLIVEQAVPLLSDRQRTQYVLI